MSFLEDPSKIERKAANHYLKKVGKTSYKLDEDKIANSERFDGFISISTNAKDLPEIEILDAYKQLYKIEHTFRTFKSYLETRPMFHWTEHRIEGHLCLCYICFTLLNYLQQELRKSGRQMSETRLREITEKLQLSLIKQGEDEFYMKSNTPEEAKALFKSLKIKELPNGIPKHDISNYISSI
jgi:transposase